MAAGRAEYPTSPRDRVSRRLAACRGCGASPVPSRVHHGVGVHGPAPSRMLRVDSDTRSEVRQWSPARCGACLGALAQRK